MAQNPAQAHPPKDASHHPQLEERPILSRLALHSQLLHFKDANGEYHTLEAPLPKDIRALLQQLKKWKS
jgi:hypothetical protein